MLSRRDKGGRYGRQQRRNELRSAKSRGNYSIGVGICKDCGSLIKGETCPCANK